MRRPRAAIALVEATMAVLVVGIAIAAGLYAASTSVQARVVAQRRATAAMLLSDLQGEILPLDYVDPQTPANPMGLDSGESFTTSRSTLDDIDDYKGWSQTGITNRAGDAVSAYANWQRAVEVDFVDAADLSTISMTDTGIKRIRITITAPNGHRFVAESFRTSATDRAQGRP